jgi:hypothetical protein
MGQQVLITTAAQLIGARLITQSISLYIRSSNDSIRLNPLLRLRIKYLAPSIHMLLPGQTKLYDFKYCIRGQHLYLIDELEEGMVNIYKYEIRKN